MSDVITQYQNWKKQGEDLRGKAKQAMEGRFRDLLSEAVQIAEEYRADFGASLKPHAPVTAFRYKAGKAKAKKAPKVPPPKAEPPAPKVDAKISGLQKRLATARKKVDDAKAAGKPTKALEDRVYEIEDELRLSAHAQ